MKYDREDLKILHDNKRGSWVLKEVDTNSTLVVYPDRETVVEIANSLIKEDEGFPVPNRENDHHQLNQNVSFTIDIARAC